MSGPDLHGPDDGPAFANALKRALQPQLDEFVAEVQGVLWGRFDKRKLAEIPSGAVILRNIDTGRSHPAGTFASYGGGTIKAIRDTDPVVDGRLARAGWEVLLDGVAGLLTAQAEDDPRNVTVTVVATSGLTYARTITVPDMDLATLHVEREH